jgi:hypothetical protein
LGNTNFQIVFGVIIFDWIKLDKILWKVTINIPDKSDLSSIVENLFWILRLHLQVGNKKNLFMKDNKKPLRSKALFLRYLADWTAVMVLQRCLALAKVPLCLRLQNTKKNFAKTLPKTVHSWLFLLAKVLYYFCFVDCWAWI